MKNRNELIEEQVLRENIRKIVKTVKNKRTEQNKLEEQTLRKVIRKLLVEKTPVADETPHEKTGINVLRKTLKKVIPQIRDDYLSLTTDEAQRTSYIAHLINGIDNLLAPIETNMDAPEAAPEAGLEEEIEVDIGDDGEELIDLGMDILPNDEKEPEEEAPEVDDDEATLTRGIDGDHDATGRNVALSTFKQVQGTIADDFGELANDEDRELYHDYLKTNVLLWRDKFEDLLSTNLPEPTTPEYEKEKDSNGIEDNEEELFEILDI